MREVEREELLRRVEEFWDLTIEEPSALKNLLRRLERGDRFPIRVIASESSDRLEGWAALYRPKVRGSYFLDVYVRPDRRRLGLGSSLVREVLSTFEGNPVVRDVPEFWAKALPPQASP